MDQRKKMMAASHSVAADMEASFTNHDLRREADAVESKDTTAARKVQKADREKLRRDRMNEQFTELGHSLEPDRPRNDKATILNDTIQFLKDLTAESNRLRAEHRALFQESRELMQEKNELREEKASLQSDIERLKAQYQNRLRCMVPWTPVDPSMVMAPPSHSYQIPVAIPPASLPMHPPTWAFPFFGQRSPNAVPNPCSTFISLSPSATPATEQPSIQHVSSSSNSNNQDSEARSLNNRKNNRLKKFDDDDDGDVTTNLELKIPGSSAQQNIPDGERKGNETKDKKRNMTTDTGSSSRSMYKSLTDHH